MSDELVPAGWTLPEGEALMPNKEVASDPERAW
jgi:hypothetical protein